MAPVRGALLTLIVLVAAAPGTARAEEIGCPPTVGPYQLQTSAAGGTITATPAEVATASCDYRQPGAGGGVRVRAFWIDARARRPSDDPRLRCQETAPRAPEPCTGWNCPPPVRWQTLVSDTHRAYVEWTAGSPFDEPARLAMRELLVRRVVPRAAECAAGERQGAALPAQGAGAGQPAAGEPAKPAIASQQAQRPPAMPTPATPGTPQAAPGPAAPTGAVDITLRDMPSGPLAVGPGWLRRDGESFTIQSSPGQHTWWRLSREAAASLRTIGVIRVHDGAEMRNAAIVLAASDRLDAMTDGAIYAGLGRDGTQLEVHRWIGNGWSQIGAVPSAGPAGDHVDILRAADRYVIAVNGRQFSAPTASGRPDWVFFLVEGGVRASITGWRVERLP